MTDNTPQVCFSGLRRDRQNLCPHWSKHLLEGMPMRSPDFACCLTCIRPEERGVSQSKSVHVSHKAMLSRSARPRRRWPRAAAR